MYLERTDSRRKDGRVALQWRPSDALLVTLDDNYSSDSEVTDRWQYSTWFGCFPAGCSNVTQDTNGTITNFTNTNAPHGLQRHRQPDLHHDQHPGPQRAAGTSPINGRASAGRQPVHIAPEPEPYLDQPRRRHGLRPEYRTTGRTVIPAVSRSAATARRCPTGPPTVRTPTPRRARPPRRTSSDRIRTSSARTCSRSRSRSTPTRSTRSSSMRPGTRTTPRCTSECNSYRTSGIRESSTRSPTTNGSSGRGTDRARTTSRMAG